LIAIFIDADGCPVKDEVYAVAARYTLRVFLVANKRMQVPEGLGVEMIHVEQGPDVADDWIADNVRGRDVVVTADIPLAARCIDAGARVIGTNGRPFSEDSIGTALATRQLKSDLRGMGIESGGPRALTNRDRSRFSSNLDTIVTAALRDGCEGR
jgi:uncharacterized protein YaiI (UPF0178 family)